MPSKRTKAVKRHAAKNGRSSSCVWARKSARHLRFLPQVEKQERASASLLRLPNEILLQIFEFVLAAVDSDRNTYQSFHPLWGLLCLCRRTYEIARPLLWSTFTLQQSVKRIPGSNTWSRTLYRGEPMQKLNVPVQLVQQLEFDISSLRYYNESTAFAADEVDNFPNVQALKFTFRGFSDFGLSLDQEIIDLIHIRSRNGLRRLAITVDLDCSYASRKLNTLLLFPEKYCLSADPPPFLQSIHLRNCSIGLGQLGRMVAFPSICSINLEKCRFATRGDNVDTSVEVVESPPPAIAYLDALFKETGYGNGTFSISITRSRGHQRPFPVLTSATTCLRSAAAMQHISRQLPYLEELHTETTLFLEDFSSVIPAFTGATMEFISCLTLVEDALVEVMCNIHMPSLRRLKLSGGVSRVPCLPCAVRLLSLELDASWVSSLDVLEALGYDVSSRKEIMVSAWDQFENLEKLTVTGHIMCTQQQVGGARLLPNLLSLLAETPGQLVEAGLWNAYACPQIKFLKLSEPVVSTIKPERMQTQEPDGLQFMPFQYLKRAILERTSLEIVGMLTTIETLRSLEVKFASTQKFRTLKLTYAAHLGAQTVWTALDSALSKLFDGDAAKVNVQQLHHIKVTLLTLDNPQLVASVIGKAAVYGRTSEHLDSNCLVGPCQIAIRFRPGFVQQAQVEALCANITGHLPGALRKQLTFITSRIAS